MIPILELTTSDAVRGILGVDPEELTDEALVAAGVEDELYLDIVTWLPEGSTIETIISEGVSATKGTEQSLQYMRLSAYAKAFSAHYMLGSHDNWRYTRLTDGNVDERRNDDADLKLLKKSLPADMEKHKGALLDLLEETVEVYGFTMIGKSTLDTDPVTSA